MDFSEYQQKIVVKLQAQRGIRPTCLIEIYKENAFCDSPPARDRVEAVKVRGLVGMVSCFFTCAIDRSTNTFLLERRKRTFSGTAVEQ